MKRSIILILISCSLLMLNSCKKKTVIPEPALPPITQEGLHTFGFMFGSEVWIPNVYFSTGLPTLSATYSMYTDGLKLDLVCRRENPQNPNAVDPFYLKYANQNISPGTYALNDTNCKIDMLVRKADNSNKEFRLHDTGSITFTRWDLVNQIASGSFSLTVKEITTGEIVSISQGRFDVKLTN